MLTGFILMTSFSVTVVYAQELVPGKIGTMSGLTVGLAFGMGAIGSVGLGYIADLDWITNDGYMVWCITYSWLSGFPSSNRSKGTRVESNNKKDGTCAHPFF